MTPIADLIKTPILWGAILLLLMALLISFAATIKRMVAIYTVQAVMLAIVTILTAIETARWQVLLLCFLPFLLAVYVRPLLARATVPGNFSVTDIFRVSKWKEWTDNAEPVWLDHGKSRITNAVSTFVNLILTVWAFFIAFRLTPTGRKPIDSISLAISLGLLLVGLFVMIVKTDIISQIMGLLIMEHGLFLAAIKIVTVPSLAVTFVASMFFYIFVTLLILVYLLPRLREKAGSIEISDMNKLKG